LRIKPAAVPPMMRMSCPFVEADVSRFPSLLESTQPESLS
jgi:hypothetical protein